MLKAFRERHAWAAVLLTVIFGPGLSMLYVGRGWLGLLYLAIEAFGTGFVLWFTPEAEPTAGVDYLFLWLAIRVVGTAHILAIVRAETTSYRDKWYARWYSLIGLLFVLPLVIALSLRAFVFQLFNMPSGSMIPNVVPGDYFVVSKMAYYGTEPERGDVVVVKFNGQDYVKRIAGVPGDRIQMQEGVLTINGKPVSLKHLSDVEITDQADMKRRLGLYRETLPGGRSYTIANQFDDGPFDNTDVFAVPAGMYFVLGDNRDDSNDSRANVGYVPRDQIVGKVWRKFRDGRTNASTWSIVE
ncbi:MAG TPA: signal peptidase I [Rhizomicrobium sp.]|jgi:signal peptidase I|nr:signal peptidase I [Rhizomicrobium sp.]